MELIILTLVENSKTKTRFTEISIIQAALDTAITAVESAASRAMDVAIVLFRPGRDTRAQPHLVATR